MALGLATDECPTGWYQICWSDELAPGDAKPMRYFGQDLVAMRSDDGVVAVLDAYCPHLGAHLGYGGRVEGDTIVCPFHGWKFDQQGHNVEIPYGTRVNKARPIRCWNVVEVNGWVMTWYDAKGREPSWDPPVIEEFASGSYRVIGRQRHDNVRLQPQLIIENMVDAQHQVDVHGGTVPLLIDRTEADGPTFRTWCRLTLGKGKTSTWLTPGGETQGELNMEGWGLGMFISRHLVDCSIHAQNTTPIDPEHSNSFATVYSGLPDDPESQALAEKRFRFEMKHFEKDLLIWEHMRYEQRPPLVGFEVKPFGEFRRWSRQFYPD